MICRNQSLDLSRVAVTSKEWQSKGPSPGTQRSNDLNGVDSTSQVMLRRDPGSIGTQCNLIPENPLLDSIFFNRHGLS